MENEKRLIWDEDVHRRLVDLAVKRGNVAIPLHRITNILFNESQTVDAMEVVHGKWIKDGESIYCSACGFETSSLLPYVCDGEKWVPCYANKYCGNCGAKMDGGK